MKKKIVFLIALIVWSINSFAQMSTADKAKVSFLNKEIGRLQRLIDARNFELVNLIDYTKEIKLAEVEIDSLKSSSPKTVYGLKFKGQALKERAEFLKSLKKKQVEFEMKKWKIEDTKTLSLSLDDYKASRESILQRCLSDSETPKELGCIQEKRLYRGLEYKHADRVETNEARRENLTFEKLKKNSIIGDSLGLMGIIINKYYVPITFKFTSLDGGENKSILVGPGKVIQWKLITGNYLVTCFDGGRQLGQPREVSANTVLNRYVDKVDNHDVDIECHWYAYMPSR
jgi:hypothetical protein